MGEGRKEREASLKFDLAMQAYQTVSSPYRNASPTETKAVLQKFDEIVKRFARTLPGRLSLLYQGNLHLKLGEFDKAAEAYETFLSKSGGERIYTVLSLEGLGYAREGKKEYEKAIEAYQRILTLGESFESKEAHLNIGRCFEELGKNGEAVEHYKAFLEIKQKSLMTDLVLRKISLLEK
jgi:tetratricopeptide (TPR) repeat protein